MNYGFVIDNRKCIGCHACTVACKSEHDVPLGVNRTHVKYVEKGMFPDTRRVFAVHRCNHCEAAPCTDICPTSALYTRSDGIVDFDNRRCIGCKACMQACPYDALYIDPVNHTAAKCNYCVHRLEGGYEPACVIVCPVEAIISGDLDNSRSHISHLVAREQVSVRKPEKNTKPNVFYINGDVATLDPTSNPQALDYLFSSQAAGVGHFAQAAAHNEGLTDDKLLIKMALQMHEKSGTRPDQRAVDAVIEELEAQESSAGLSGEANMYRGQRSRRVYDTPGKGILWGWEVPAYIWTKAVAAGTFFMMYLSSFLTNSLTRETEMAGLFTSIGFLLLTTGLLVKDLDKPSRFAYVLLRPNWSSWLTRGGYILVLFTSITGLLLLNIWLPVPFYGALIIFGGLLAVLTAVYTAFLLAQAKGRDLWQSPMASLQMLIHAVIAGSAMMMYIEPLSLSTMAPVLAVGLMANLLIITLEVITPHGSTDLNRTIRMITKGSFRTSFYTSILLGNVIPLLFLLMGGGIFTALGGILALAGIFLAEYIWVKAPQMIPLS